MANVHSRSSSHEEDLRSSPYPSPWCSLCSSSSLCVVPHLTYNPHSCPCLAVGLMIRPKTENLDVIVNISDTESWDQHVQKLNKFLERECGAGDVVVWDLGQGTEDLGSRTSGPCSLSPTSLAYNDSIQAQKNDVCRPGRYYEQPDNGVLNYPKRACQFNRTQLGDCSGIGDPTHYGYSTGQPCVFIKMNRVPMTLVPRENGGGSWGHHLLAVASFQWGLWELDLWMFEWLREQEMGPLEDEIMAGRPDICVFGNFFL